MKLLICSLFFSFNLIIIQSAVSQKILNIYNEKEEKLSYVNISIKNEAIGSHTNENGEIAIHKRFINEKFVFSKAGYRDTTLILDPDLESIIMERVAIHKEKYPSTTTGKRVVRIGTISRNTSHFLSNSGNPQISLEYFPGDHHGYKLDKILFQTSNEIDLAKVNIRIYAATAEMKPGKYLHENDIIVEVKKGKQINKVDLDDYDLKMPKEGLFIGLESLIISENIFKYQQKDLMTDEVSEKKKYMPAFVINKNQSTVNKLFPTYVFLGGKLNKLTNNNMSLSMQLKLKRP